MCSRRSRKQANNFEASTTEDDSADDDSRLRMHVAPVDEIRPMIPAAETPTRNTDYIGGVPLSGERFSP